MKRMKSISNTDKAKLYYCYNPLDLRSVECAKEEEMQTLPNDISEMNARDMKIYCLEWRVTHDCAKEVCELYKRHMCAEAPHKWELKQDGLTPKEVAICNILGAKYVTMDRELHAETVDLWSVKPVVDETGEYGYAYNCVNLEGWIASVDSIALPSVHPGDCIDIEESQQNQN